MFAVGDFVVYGTSGVYLIEECRLMDFDRVGVDKREYFVLKPLRANASGVYVPVDSAENRLRGVTPKEELLAALEAMRGKKIRWIDERKRRTQVFRAILAENVCTKMISLLSCLYRKQNELMRENKKLSFSDADVLMQAETSVSGELAFSLELDFPCALTMLRNYLE